MPGRCASNSGPVTKITDEDLEEVLRLVRDEGQRLATIARKYGVTREALYMRRLRNEDFAEALKAAEAEGEMRLVRELRDALSGQKANWQGMMCFLERRFSRPKKDDPEDRGWLSADTIAKVDAAKDVPTEAREPDPRFE